MSCILLHINNHLQQRQPLQSNVHITHCTQMKMQCVDIFQYANEQRWLNAIVKMKLCRDAERNSKCMQNEME